MEHAIDLMTTDEMTRMPERRDEAGFGALSTERGQLPLAAMSVNARVVGLVAHVELEQTFVNSTGEPIEAVYIFPLPDRAAVSRFRMDVNGRIIEGVIKERGQARREYAEAIRTGHRAAITEEDRPGVFTMQVGNLMPGERAVVRLDMTGPVPIEEGDATFRFPLVVAPRYIPGVPLPGESVGDGVAADTSAVPDASRISPPVLLPGFPNPVRLRITLAIDPLGMPLGKLRSSLHSTLETHDEGVRRIALAPGDRLDRDFIVRFRLGDGAVRTSLILAPDSLARDSEDKKSADSEGTFLLTMTPPANLDATEKPRDVVFVLDRSGSMMGWKMVAARRAVARMVDTLGDADRFLVMAFDDRIESPPGLDKLTLGQATDRNRFRAVEYLAGLQGRGGTEMMKPLNLAADCLAGGYAERDRVLVLVTDGQVGNEDQILRGLSQRLKNVRVFTLGIDQAVNAAFLRRLAGMGGGACALVESEDRLDTSMDAIHRRIATPVVTELSVQGEGGLSIDADSIVPGRIPDLFAGAPIAITGRYRGAGSIRLQGQQASGQPWHEHVPGRACRSREAAKAAVKIWARGLVRELEDRYVTGRGDPAELQQRIVRTSLDYSVLCRFTAFLAVDRSERVNPGGEPNKVVQPVDAPAGWDLGPGAAQRPSSVRTRSGVAGFDLEADGFSGIGGAAAPRSMGAPLSMSAPPPPPSPGAPPPPMQQAMAAPRPAERRRGGMLSRIRGRFAGKQQPSIPEPEAARAEATGVALTPYIDRLRRMRDNLDTDLRAGLGDPRARCLALMARLRVLIEDLESVTVPAGVANPTNGGQRVLDGLRDLMTSLAALRAHEAASDDAAIVAGLGQAVATMDRLLAQTPDAPAPSPRREFWK